MELYWKSGYNYVKIWLQFDRGSWLLSTTANNFEFNCKWELTAIPIACSVESKSVTWINSHETARYAKRNLLKAPLCAHFETYTLFGWRFCKTSVWSLVRQRVLIIKHCVYLLGASIHIVRDKSIGTLHDSEWERTLSFKSSGALGWLETNVWKMLWNLW